ncbi:outer membrane lipoprotein carrier protein LolA [Allosaccharopolyspora coralli]|uniref:Outer membrane lipoprotein carrier protein LolA n=1 Tax=Allosaccharopolyspora coralli TaxID=2665642 RepID=A0A5Q3Q4U2_9PSEU|nr:outer membrane lipoprotein carrier protein LolA [Allosaccharopolyspora coralli]QGK68850.1 outer membrane lipoprotein carrier protein LolA [Allosaccharopolyspora coralli]
MQSRRVAVVATAGAAAGVLGLAALSLPSATANPTLPEIPPEKLVESVMTSSPPAFSGTVTVDNALGLPALPGAGGEDSGVGAMLADGEHTMRVWSDGADRHRVSLPSESGERTIVHDGSTVWTWDSATRTASRSDVDPAKQQQREPHHAQERPADPAEAARAVVGTLRESSTVTVDGTASVAGRDAYELVLTPKPSERTVLREVRVAVDAEKRVPLNVVVNTHGSDDPALRVGFSELDMTVPEARLFQFTPPAGTTVEEPQRQEKAPEQAQKPPHRKVGDGWDTVTVSRLPEQALQQGDDEQNRQDGPGGQDVRALADQVGTKVSGPWGDGWVVTTKAGSALLTSDGRVAVGAVPEQVLTDAIGNS